MTGGNIKTEVVLRTLIIINEHAVSHGFAPCIKVSWICTLVLHSPWRKRREAPQPGRLQFDISNWEHVPVVFLTTFIPYRMTCSKQQEESSRRALSCQRLSPRPSKRTPRRWRQSRWWECRTGPCGNREISSDTAQQGGRNSCLKCWRLEVQYDHLTFPAAQKHY